VFKKFIRSQWRDLKRNVRREQARKVKYTPLQWVIIIVLALWVSSYIP
jgi:hypothetical protein